MSVSLEQIWVERISCQLHTGITAQDEGKAVTLIGNNKVGLGSSGDPVHGKLVKVEPDGIGAVEVRGFVELGYTGSTAPTVGGVVVVDGLGNVVPKAEPDVTDRTHIVWSVDTTAKTVICLF